MLTLTDNTLTSSGDALSVWLGMLFTLDVTQHQVLCKSKEDREGHHGNVALGEGHNNGAA